MTTRQLELSRPTGLTGPTKSDRSDQSDPALCPNGSDSCCAAKRRFAEQCIDNLLEGTIVGQLPVGAPLTKREKQILQSILAGQTNKQIARALCRSQRTIEYHRNQLMQKLNAHNAAELIRGAIEMGLVGQTVRQYEKHSHEGTETRSA